MENPVLPSSCVTPAGTSIEVQNEWEENTNTHIQYSAQELGEVKKLLIAQWDTNPGPIRRQWDKVTINTTPQGKSQLTIITR